MTTLQTRTRPASLSEYRERLQQMQAPLMAESTRHGLMYRPQPSDLFITPFAKCGTTWLQQIVHGLRTQGDMDFDDISRVIPWLEMAHRQELDLYAPQRGDFQAFKCHLSWLKIPKGGRYIVSFRDPKDALVSMYAMLDGWHWQAGAISITDYARHFYLRAQGDGWNGSYWGHLVSWWEQRHNPNVLLLSYEGMKADLPATVQTIADFLAIDLDPALHELVVKQASFDFMMAHKWKFADPIARSTAAKEGLWLPTETFTKIRNGRVGDHRVELPAEIAVEMDAIWRETVESKTGLSSYQALRAALA